MKSKLTNQFHRFVFLQETHMRNSTDGKLFNTQWNRMHGIATEERTTFLSEGVKGKEGVAILMNPHEKHNITPIWQEHWSSRFLALAWKRGKSTIYY